MNTQSYLKLLLLALIAGLLTVSACDTIGSGNEENKNENEGNEETPVPGESLVRLMVTAEPEEGGSVDPETGEFKEGEEVVVTATPSDGWIFMEWESQDDITSSENPWAFAINEDTELIARFGQQPPLTELEVNVDPVDDVVVNDIQHEYYFSGIAGVNYSVILTPQLDTDDPDLLVFASQSDMENYWDIADANGGEDSKEAIAVRLGKSSNSPGEIDRVDFTASENQDFYIIISGPEEETAHYSIQVSGTPEIPGNGTFDIQLNDGRTTTDTTLTRGPDYTVANVPGTYDVAYTVYEHEGYGQEVVILDAGGTGTSPDGSPLTWSIVNGSIVIRVTDEVNSKWTWVLTRLDSGSVLIQPDTPPGQEDAVNFTVVGSFTAR